MCRREKPVLLRAHTVHTRHSPVAQMARHVMKTAVTIATVHMYAHGNFRGYIDICIIKRRVAESSSAPIKASAPCDRRRAHLPRDADGGEAKHFVVLKKDAEKKAEDAS